MKLGFQPNQEVFLSWKQRRKNPESTMGRSVITGQEKSVS
jgi:hypothetical protein